MSRVNRSLQLMESLINDSRIAVFAKDNHGRYIWINVAGATMLGRPPAEIIGHTDFHLFEKSSAQMILQREAQLIYRGESREYQSVARVNGVWHHYRSSKHVYSGSNGIRDHIVGFSMTMTDSREPSRLDFLRRAHKCLQTHPRALAAFMARLCTPETAKIAN